MTTTQAAPATEPTLTVPTLTVSDVARASGVAASAVRFYDKHGLVTSHRTAGNQRRYFPVDGCLIKIVRVAQRAGLSIAEIRELMADLPQDRSRITIEDFLGLRRALEWEVRQRIQALTDVLDDLVSDQKLCEVPTSRRR